MPGGIGTSAKDSTVQIRDVRHRLSHSLFTVPVIVVLLIVVLGMSKVSGSSIALDDLPDAASPVAWSPRPVRSDEYATRTPMVVRQAELDFPAETEVGMGSHDTGVLSDLPVKSFSAIQKPHSWAYFVLDVERAFALEWWLTALGPFLGIYALLAVLTRSILLSSLGGLLAAAAPAALWWLIPSAGLSILYGALTCTLFVVGARATTSRAGLTAAGAGGWTAACFATMLYLPWLIPLTLLFGAIVISQLPNVKEHWRRLLGLAVLAGGIFGVLMAVFYKQHHDALQAITTSVYPGDRRSPGGEGRSVLFFDVPYDVFSAARRLTTVSGTNQSEAASGLMLWVPILIAGHAFAGFRRDATRPARALTATMVVSVLLSAWGLLPVPSWLGAVFGLTRVQGPRVVLPVAVASVIAAVLYVHRVRTEALRPAWWRILVASLAFAIITASVGMTIRIGNDSVPAIWVIVIVLVVGGVTAAILDGRAWLGIGGCCAFVLFGSVRINPVQATLDPLLDNPVSRQIEEVRRDDESARWVALGLDYRMKSTLVASGAPVVNGVSWYADDATWEKTDPDQYSRDLWDRYGLITVALDDGLEGVQYELRATDSIIVYSPSCTGLLQTLDVRFVLNDEEFVSPCLREVARPEAPGERWIYEVVTPTG